MDFSTVNRCEEQLKTLQEARRYFAMRAESLELVYDNVFRMRNLNERAVRTLRDMKSLFQRSITHFDAFDKPKMIAIPPETCQETAKVATPNVRVARRSMITKPQIKRVRRDSMHPHAVEKANFSSFATRAQRPRESLVKKQVALPPLPEKRRLVNDTYKPWLHPPPSALKYLRNLKTKALSDTPRTKPISYAQRRASTSMQRQGAHKLEATEEPEPRAGLKSSKWAPLKQEIANHKQGIPRHMEERARRSSTRQSAPEQSSKEVKTCVLEKTNSMLLTKEPSGNPTAELASRTTAKQLADSSNDSAFIHSARLNNQPKALLDKLTNPSGTNAQRRRASLPATRRLSFQTARTEPSTEASKPERTHWQPLRMHQNLNPPTKRKLAALNPRASLKPRASLAPQTSVGQQTTSRVNAGLRADSRLSLQPRAGVRRALTQERTSDELQDM